MGSFVPNIPGLNLDFSVSESHVGSCKLLFLVLSTNSCFLCYRLVKNVAHCTFNCQKNPHNYTLARFLGGILQFIGTVSPYGKAVHFTEKCCAAKIHFKRTVTCRGSECCHSAAFSSIPSWGHIVTSVTSVTKFLWFRFLDSY